MGKSACLLGGDAGGVSGFSEGAGPGGHTGRCLFGIGIGHVVEELMDSKFIECVRVGLGDVERCGAMGRGKVMVAIGMSSLAVSEDRFTRLERRTRKLSEARFFMGDRGGATRLEAVAVSTEDDGRSSPRMRRTAGSSGELWGDSGRSTAGAYLGRKATEIMI